MKTTINILRCVVLFFSLPYLLAAGCTTDGIGVSSMGYLPLIAIFALCVSFLPSGGHGFVVCLVVASLLVAMHTIVLSSFSPSVFRADISHVFIILGLWAVLPLGILRHKEGNI